MVTHILVTGGGGFIGSHLCARLWAEGHRVTCLDNFDDFYAPAVKQENVQRLLAREVPALSCPGKGNRAHRMPPRRPPGPCAVPWPLPGTAYRSGHPSRSHGRC